MFTDTERALLHALATHIGAAIADPDYAIARLREANTSGRGRGFAYRITTTAITGQWHQWLPTHHDRYGHPTRWANGPLLGEATITHTRLHHWINTLPAGIRAQALTHWSTHPHDTRDLNALTALTHTAIDHTTPPTLFDLPTLPT